MNSCNSKKKKDNSEVVKKDLARTFSKENVQRANKQKEMFNTISHQRNTSQNHSGMPLYAHQNAYNQKQNKRHIITGTDKGTGKPELLCIAHGL